MKRKKNKPHPDLVMLRAYVRYLWAEKLRPFRKANIKVGKLGKRRKLIEKTAQDMFKEFSKLPEEDKQQSRLELRSAITSFESGGPLKSGRERIKDLWEKELEVTDKMSGKDLYR